MSTAHQAYIRRETVVSAVINMIMTAVFFIALFGDQLQVNLWGTNGLVMDSLVQGFMVGLFSVVPVSLILRMRLRKGVIRTPDDIHSALPRSFIGRTVLLSVLSMVSLTAIAAGLAVASGQTTISFHSGLVLKLLAAAVISAIVTPMALRAMFAAR
jgi:hypothetical protein